MARNGSGTFTLAAGNPVVTGTTISSTVFNNTMSEIATALTQSIAVDGQTPVTANVPMNSKKLTGLAAATAAGDALSYGQAAMGAIAGSTGTFSGAVAAANLASGTYTPTITNVANCAAVVVGLCQYLRFGSTVTVSGRLNIDPTSTATFTRVGISLPIASALASAEQLAGVAANCIGINSENNVAQISADATNYRAQLEFYSSLNVPANLWSFTFTYLIV